MDRLHALDFVLADGIEREYWNESVCWELSQADVAVLEAATLALHEMSLRAAAHAVAHDLGDFLGIPEPAWRAVKASWRRGDPSLYGRMDLRWDGVSPPQLLEYNADTPTALYEAAVLQWDWLEQTRPAADQFNSLHEALIAAWGGVAQGAPVHFTCLETHLEDRITTESVRDTAPQAGVLTGFINLPDIGWDGQGFVDFANRPIRRAFKLYPTEWMFREEFGPRIEDADTRWIEPPWRLILSSKAILALLWQLNPGHPNLLPAAREKGRIGGPEIAKPLFGREGANISAPGFETPGPFAKDGRVYQAWRELPCVGGMYPVFGTWVVDGRACGLGIREDTTPITRDTSCFVPHFFNRESRSC